MHYRGYTITYSPKPIPIRTCDWDFVHDEYDWAPDGPDHRCGHAESLEDAKRQIDEIEEEA